MYTLFWVALFPLMWYACTQKGMVATKLGPVLEPLSAALGFPVTVELAVAVVVAYSPIPLAMLLSALTGDKFSWRWPFHKESIVGVFGLFFLAAWAVCILPIYHSTLWVLQL